MAKGVEIKGLPELAAKLNLAAMVARQAAEKALREEVDAVGSDAEQGAPSRTGELRGGIQRQASGTEGRVEATARHSKFVEHGTYKDPAQPFMQPAAEKSRLRWPARAGALIKTALEGICR